MPTNTRSPDQAASDLIRDTEAILSKWETRIRARVIDEPETQPSHILRNNLPDLLEALARVVADPDAKIDAKVIDVAHTHANERVRLTDFSLPDILDEYSLFRQVVFEHLQTNGPISRELQQRIHLAIDRSVREATIFFVEEKKNLETSLEAERDQFLQRMGAANRRLKALLDQMPIGVAIAERPSGKMVYFNRAATDVLGHPLHTSADYTGYNQYTALHQDLTPYTPEEYPLAKAARSGERVEREEMLYRRGDGQVAHLSVHAAPVEIEGSEPDLAVAMFDDISALKEAQAALAKEQEFAQVTLEAMGDGVITTDAEGRIERMNPAAESLTGWTMPLAQGQSILEVVHLTEEQDDIPSPLPVAKCLAQNRIGETRSLVMLRHTTNIPTPVTYSLAPIHGAAGQVIGSVTILHDASLEWRLLQEMSHEAQHDALTGLVNRREFERRLRQLLSRTLDDGISSVLLYLDLDQFKVVNDSCGHAAGDALLVQLATVLREHIRDQDTLARLGGDEFAIILDNCHQDNAVEIANSLRETVKEFVFHWGEQPFQVGVSIGLLEINQNATSVSTLIRRADDACYLAKEAGRNRVHVAQPTGPGTQPARPRTNWAALVERAIETDRLVLFGQRVAALKNSGGRDGLEFLVRLKGTDDSLVPPASFLPAAERHNLMSALDYWVVEQALRWLSEHDGRQFGFYILNISAHTVNDEDAQNRLMGLLEKAPVTARRLCFEITELAGTRNLRNAAKFISRLKVAGFNVSMEDIGTGTASFRHLKTLAVDYLKIDGSFITGMNNNGSDLAVVRSINEVGHIFGKRTIAKFVDTPEALAQLKHIGFDFAQGNHIGAPDRLGTFWDTARQVEA